ncbi:MAG: type I polyketide synthase [Steroidobacterales bacterium]
MPIAAEIPPVADATTIRADHDVAIVGMACRFPGARNLEEFWQNLLLARDTISILSDEELSPAVPAELRQDPRYVRAAGLLDQPYAMDAEFFGINPLEAKLTDPQQRILLETSWQALEHAGESLGPATERTAVYAGVEDNTYYKFEILPFPDAERRAGRFAVMTGNEKDYVAMRIAYRLNLKGPAVSVHTACSTSLVAVIMGCKSLRQRECDMALAGGASVHFPTPEGYYYQEGGVFSPDGHCRPFDRDARGTTFTDGAGMVVLKRVEDALRDRNTIFAVIKGGAINSDGGDKVSFSAPSVSGQAGCIREALTDAGVDAGTIQYVETHGTATPVGDPIEVEGLRQAFAARQDATRLQYCGLGSVKSNIGHTTAAAGVASLIKTAQAMHHGVIPATVHFKHANPALDLENSPFYIVADKLDWPHGHTARRAGVSSFGIGGTNSHLILEESPAPPGNARSDASRPFEVWPVSAKSAAQRDQLIANLSLERHGARDVAHTLQHGRRPFGYRGALIRMGDLSIEDMLVQPSAPALEKPQAVFMFPGQGSQYLQMGQSLYAYLPEFRATFDQCCAVLSGEMSLDFKAFVFDAANQATLEDTRYTQPALFAIEVSLGRMLLDWGIHPTVMIGHSIGEFAAAQLAGVFELDDALKLIAARGRLMSGLPGGRMLSVRGPLDKVIAAAGEAVDIASVNGFVHCALAGEHELIARVQARLEASGLPCRPLHTSHAFHSAMMSPVVGPFLDVVRSVPLRAPKIPIISTVTGTAMTAADATDPCYWANHLRSTVRFSPALLASLELGGNIFVEVGPRTTLSSLAIQHFAKAAAPDAARVAIPVLGDQPTAQSELGGVGMALAKLWCSGMELSWERVWSGGRKVPLASTYPFARRDFRFSEGRQEQRRMTAAPNPEPTATYAIPQAAMAAAPTSEQRLVAELTTLFGDCSGLAVERLEHTFVECGFDSLALMQIGVELGKRYGVAVALRDLMERLNTLPMLAAHIAAHAAPGKLRHLAAASGCHLPAIASPAPVPASPPVASAESVQQELAMMKDYIDRQLEALKLHLADSPAVPPAIVSGPGVVRPPEQSDPLIRARHVDPPQPGAFRIPGTDHDTWFRFDAVNRRYERLN